MSLLAAASDNQVLPLLVDALHLMSEETRLWDDKRQRSALRNYEEVVAAIEDREPDRARLVMETSLAAALRHWEQAAPDELKQPVAWIGS